MNTMAGLLAETFLTGLWQGLVLMVVVAMVLRLFPRLGPAARFGIWGSAFVAAAVVPFVRMPHHASAGDAGVRVSMAWGFAIASVWAGLVVWRLGQLVGQGVRLRRIWTAATPTEVPAEIGELLREMPRGPVVCVSAAVDAPSVIGFWAPKLLIPAWQMGSLSEGELRQIVLHECEHLRRGDDWMNLAQKVGLALFPLNPALLWADRRMGLERELACDAGVIGRTGDRFDYARCLTRLAEQRIGRRTLALALSAWAGESELGRRVGRLLRPVGSMSRGRMRLSLAALGLVVASGSLELARMPRLVSFGDVGAEVARGSALPGSASESRGARIVPVVYREPVRVVAVSPSWTVAARSGGGRRRAAVRMLRRPIPVVRALRVSATEERTTSSAKMRTVALESSRVGREAYRLVDAFAVPVSYAAVPFANGWLILQL